jgi:hypothetical protein
MKNSLFKMCRHGRHERHVTQSAGMSGMGFYPLFCRKNKLHAGHAAHAAISINLSFFGGGYTATQPQLGGLTA